MIREFDFMKRKKKETHDRKYLEPLQNISLIPTETKIGYCSLDSVYCLILRVPNRQIPFLGMQIKRLVNWPLAVYNAHVRNSREWDRLLFLREEGREEKENIVSR